MSRLSASRRAVPRRAPVSCLAARRAWAGAPRAPDSRPGLGQYCTHPATSAFRLSVWCGVIAQWCKHRFLHRCKRQCDGKCRGIGWSRAASPVERRAEAGDCGGGIQVRCGSARRGASGRRDAEFSLPLAAGSSGRGFAQVLVASAGDGVAVPPVPAIEIEFASCVPMRIPAAVSPALAAAVVEALARR
jgi:hypothetical protein